MATHSSIRAWRIPWTEEPGGSATIHGVTESRVFSNFLASILSTAPNQLPLNPAVGFESF